jgi:Na+/H+-dicarboxylate symporter
MMGVYMIMASKKGLLIKISLGFILGMAFGFLFGPQLLNKEHFMGEWVMPFLDVIGILFIRLLTMLIIPLVFSSLMAGTASLGDIRTLGRVGGKTIFWFALTTVIAVGIGLALTNFVQPGSDFPKDPNVKYTARQPVPPKEVFLGMIPGYPARPTSFLTKVELDSEGKLVQTSGSVPFTPMSAIGEGVMLQIIVFAMLLGIAAALVGKKSQAFVDFSQGLAETMYGVTDIVLQLAPYGVFALIAQTAANYGPAILLPFAKVIICMYVGVIIHAFVVYSGMISIFARKSPMWFFRGVTETAITAFVSRSSSGTLPITIENARTKLGVPSNIASFVLPLGATVNMNGTCLYQGVCALFVAEVYGLDLTVAQQFTIILTAALAAVGAAGVPGAGLIMLTMVLTSVGLPLEGAGLVAGIDVILDMARTCINVIGDQCVAVVVAKSEGVLYSEVPEP